MKFLEKISLVLFSIIIGILSVVLIFIMLDVININIITRAISDILVNETAIKTTLIICSIALVLAVKCIFFRSKPEDDGKNGVVLENEAGKLVISKESLENLIASVVKEVQGIEAISSRTILDKNKNLIVYVTTLVSKDIMIKDVSVQIQEKIKEALNKTADLEVKQVNIKIKNITNKKIKGLPPATKEDIAEENTETIENSEVEENQE